MKKTLSLLLATVLLAGMCGCAAGRSTDVGQDESSIAQTPPIPDYETTDWDACSIQPSDYGITDEMLSFMDMPDFSQLSLAALCAYALHTDGAGAEGSFDELYQRFMEAPHTVLNYLALLGDQAARGGDDGTTAAEALCRAIASADVVWYDSTQAFADILETCKAIYPSGRVASLLTSLETEHAASSERSG